MKVGVVGFGSRIAYIYHEFKKINSGFEVVSFVDPDPIGKDYAEKYKLFPSSHYSNLNEMLLNENLDLLMVGSPNHLHLDHIKQGLEAGLKIFAEKPIVTTPEWQYKLDTEWGFNAPVK